jgi:hypothetical protein
MGKLYRKHLLETVASESLVKTAPYPIWCKDYTDQTDPIIVWAGGNWNEVFSDTFDIRAEDLPGMKESEVFPWHIADPYKDSDHLALSDGVHTCVEKTGIEGQWGEVITTKWRVVTDFFGHKLRLVYGMCVPNERYKE